MYKDTVRTHVYIRNLKHFENHISLTSYSIKEIKPIQLEEWQNKLLEKMNLIFL